jgi:hypothetical protein
VCNYQALPGLLFPSSTDQTNPSIGLTCQKLDKPLPGTSWTTWSTFWKIAKLIEGLPF